MRKLFTALLACVVVGAQLFIGTVSAQAVGFHTTVNCTPMVFGNDNFSRHGIIKYDMTQWSNGFNFPPFTMGAITYPDLALDGANSTLYGIRTDGSLDVLNFAPSANVGIIRHVTPQMPQGLAPLTNVHSGTVLPGGTIAISQGEQVYYINPFNGQVSPYFSLAGTQLPDSAYNGSISSPGAFVTMADGSLLVLANSSNGFLTQWGARSILIRVSNGVATAVGTVHAADGMSRAGDYIYIGSKDGRMYRYPASSIPTTLSVSFLMPPEFYQLPSAGAYDGYYGLAGTEDSTSSACSNVGLNGFTTGVDAYASTAARNPPPPGTIPTFTVSFNANGGSGSMPAQTASTSTALTSNQYSRTGYTFAGWNTQANGQGTNYANGASYPFTSSAVLYAQWSPIQYQATFDLQGGAPAIPGENYNYGGSLLLPPAPYRAGYNFQGWFLSNSGGTALAPQSLYTPPLSTGNFTLYAQWVAATDPIVTPTAIVRPVGQSNLSNVFVRSFQGSGSATSMTLTLEGMNVATEVATPVGINVGAAGTTCGTSGITVYQQATSVLVNCTVVNSGNNAILTLSGGTVASHQFEFVLAAQSFTFTAVPVNGYRIVTDFVSGGPSYVANLTNTWQMATFNSNDGQQLQTFEIANQPSALSANTFTLPGYSFTGWNTQPNGQGTAYGAAAVYGFTQNLNVYAQWNPVSYAVTYDTQGGSAIPTGSYTTGSPFNLPGAPYREGATFLGWYTSSTGGIALGTDYAPPGIGNITLYAHWEELAHTGNSFNELLKFALLMFSIGVFLTMKARRFTHI